MIEVFEDICPMAASHFRSRCLPGGTASLQGSRVHSLIPHYALFMGKRCAVCRLGVGVWMGDGSGLEGVASSAQGRRVHALIPHGALSLETSRPPSLSPPPSPLAGLRAPSPSASRAAASCGTWRRVW